MIDKERAEHLTDVAGECNRFNEISRPLGYAVTATTTADDPTVQQFTIHRLDKTVASGPKFATVEEARAHLEAIAKLPLWRLDLLDNSAIVFDPAELEITDPSTGESFSFRGWGLEVAQLAASGQRSGAQEGVTNLAVRSEDPPTIGNWYKSDVGRPARDGEVRTIDGDLFAADVRMLIDAAAHRARSELGAPDAVESTGNRTAPGRCRNGRRRRCRSWRESGWRPCVGRFASRRPGCRAAGALAQGCNRGRSGYRRPD
jgi:hypothetical protein